MEGKLPDTPEAAVVSAGAPGGTEFRGRTGNRARENKKKADEVIEVVGSLYEDRADEWFHSYEFMQLVEQWGIKAGDKRKGEDRGGYES